MADTHAETAEAIKLLRAEINFIALTFQSEHIRNREPLAYQSVDCQMEPYYFETPFKFCHYFYLNNNICFLLSTYCVSGISRGYF